LLVADRIAGLLQREGAELIVGFPENRLLNSGALIGMRPIVTRTEKVAVNIADGYARMTNGDRISVCAVQYGPGAESAFGAVARPSVTGARSWSSRASTSATCRTRHPASVSRSRSRPVTRFAATLSDAKRGPEVFRRALNALRGVRHGPVLVAVANDVLNQETADPEWSAGPPLPRLTQAPPEDVDETLHSLLAARKRVIVAGQGVLFADACAELVRFAELTETPVATTLNGKSAFPENHPLALGTAARTRPAMVDRFFERAELILGIGTSFTRSLYITPMPSNARLGQIVNDPRDMGSGYEVSFGCLGDVRLVLRQMIERLDSDEPREQSGTVVEEIASIKSDFMSRWKHRLTSGESPINPYRVVWELMHVVDRNHTVVTHDAGHPRDQVVPFYESIAPRGYLGWGKTTQLGTGLGLAMGARLARPDWLSVNIMGDAAFGMVAMDFETAVRCKIPILTIVLNNGVMGGYGEYMPDAVKAYGANRLGGDYTAIARALGGHAERVAEAADLRPAIERCIGSVRDGRAALLEVMTREEPAMALGS
jgi:acetolactate synthase-1/2/3 large subunit